MKYFPDYQNKIHPNKTFMLNVVNTIDPGLIIRTIKRIKDQREVKAKETPIKILPYFKKRLLNFTTIKSETKQVGAGNILYFDYP